MNIQERGVWPQKDFGWYFGSDEIGWTGPFASEMKAVQAMSARYGYGLDLVGQTSDGSVKA